ncbi:MAG: TetR/AcrR family transcriptional regulator [bacterium]
MAPREQGEISRAKLIAAMTDVAREKGYHATRIEDVCAAAGVTKGSFFHHFASREDLGLAAAEAWRQNTGTLFAEAEFNHPARPLDRLLGYIAFRRAMLTGPVALYACYAGTVVAETYATDLPVYPVASAAIADHITFIARHTAAALQDCGQPPTRAHALSTFIQCTIQGALILAKAEGDATPALACLDELERHLKHELTPKRRNHDPRQAVLFEEP